MASTLLEQTRAGHEEIERLERLIVKDFQKEARTHKEKLLQNHRVANALQTMQQQAERLLRVYEDKDGARKEEITALKGEDPMQTFYDRLREVQEYHRKYPSLETTEAEDDSGLRGELGVEFSGEEGLGRYLDLHEHFNRFINSKFGRQLDYLDYLSAIAFYGEVPRHQRTSKPYREYLRLLRNYLVDFQQRTQPLQDVATQQAKSAEQFEEDWRKGEVPGWEDQGEGVLPASSSGDAIDPDAFDSVEELEQLGADKLKAALTAVGLKAGGTTRQRAERLLLLRDVPLEKLDRKHFAKGVVPTGVRSPAEAAKHAAAAKDAAALERAVADVLDRLGAVLGATKANVEKRSALTYEELQAELAEAEQAVDEESDEEDDYIYNPLKLPMGWDGKPIPYWLYKLHGLNQEFKCEICGEASYWGRRAFERHFKEWRHQNGMRALGIPNNKLFYEVTKIADAQELWRNVQSREKGGFVRDTEEEYEDAQGNVYNKRTYEDLKRQGII